MINTSLFDEIKRKVNFSIRLLFKNDFFLLENDTNERTITHKLAEYLQVEFSDWNVDVEYNRKGLEKKILEGIEGCPGHNRTGRIFPDIIIHHRNTNNNLLVIEVKKKKCNSDCDIKKLKLLTSPSSKLKYKWGLFVNLALAEEPSLIWFNTGEISRHNQKEFKSDFF